jgi:hypothetical protein
MTLGKATRDDPMLHLNAFKSLYAAILALGLCATVSAAPPKNFVQKDVDPAAVLLGIPWTATRDEVRAKWTKAGLKSIEDSKFSLSFHGSVPIGGKPIPTVMVSYSYTPEGKLKEIHMISDTTAHPQWRKAGIAGLGTALVESKPDSWPGSKLFYHWYWWPLKRYTVFLQYNTIYPDPTTALESDSHLNLEIHNMGMSQAEVNSPILAKTIPSDK